jgi:hypothetical protein
MLLKNWKNGSNVWLEAGSHSRGNSQDMVEGCDLVFKLTSVHADSHAFFHASDFEVERFLVGTSGGWKFSKFLTKSSPKMIHKNSLLKTLLLRLLTTYKKISTLLPLNSLLFLSRMPQLRSSLLKNMDNFQPPLVPTKNLSTSKSEAWKKA